MKQQFDITQNLTQCTVIATTTTLADARATIQQAQSTPFVIVTGNQPIAAAFSADLAKIQANPQQPISDILSQLPAGIVIDEGRAFDSEEIKTFILLIDSQKAPGIIVTRHQQVMGLILIDLLIDGLSLSDIPPYIDERIYGNAVTPMQAYICRQCEKDDPPPTISIPRSGNIPTCSKHEREHGTRFMEILNID